MHHGFGARNKSRCRGVRARIVEKRRAQSIRDEDMLDANDRIFHQCFDQRPVARGVEPQRAARHRRAVTAKADVILCVRALAVRIENVKREIDVATALVRRMVPDRAAV